MTITADMSVEELVEEYPEAAGFLANRGLVCIRCGEAFWGSLRELAVTKNMEGQIDAIVDELKSYLETHPADA